jgi:superfamily I DNA/RNA helicase
MKVFINGGPGCGKTTELIKRFLQDDENKKVYLAFSRSARDEALARMKQQDEKIGDRPSHLILHERPTVTTIHAFAMSLYVFNKRSELGDLSAENIEKRIQSIINKIAKECNLGFIDDPTSKISRLMLSYEKQRHQLKDSIDTSLISTASNTPESTVKLVLKKYEEELKKTPLRTDFTGLLEWMHGAGLKVSDYAENIYVDETQDLTPLMISVLGVNSGKNFIYAGDLDQMIYQHMGVDPKKVYELYEEARKEYLGKVRRVPVAIFNTIKKVRRFMKYKADYDPESVNTNPGHLFPIISFDDAVHKARAFGGTTYILTYSNFKAKDLFEKLVTKFAIIPNTIGPRKLTWERDVCSLAATIAKLGDVTSEQSRSMLADLGKMLGLWKGFRNPTVQEAKSLKEKISNKLMALFGKPLEFFKHVTIVDNIFIDTVHESKGREADNVILFDLFPEKHVTFSRETDDYLAKLLYVAGTRTRRNLFIVRPRSIRIAGSRRGYVSLFGRFFQY